MQKSEIQCRLSILKRRKKEQNIDRIWQVNKKFKWAKVVLTKSYKRFYVNMCSSGSKGTAKLMEI